MGAVHHQPGLLPPLHQVPVLPGGIPLETRGATARKQGGEGGDGGGDRGEVGMWRRLG